MRLLLKSLRHYWRGQLTLLLGVALATSVLGGALVVGDSVRGSLRSLTLERLGAIDWSLTSPGLLRAELSDEISSDPRFVEGFSRAVGSIVLNAGAINADSRLRASGVGVSGVSAEFLGLFDTAGPPWQALLGAAASKRGPTTPVIINESLSQQLGASAGATLLLKLPAFSPVPRGSLMGRRDSSEVLETMRLTVAGVVPDRGIGRFGLTATQRRPLNAFVALPVLQRALGSPGAINSLFVTQRDQSADSRPAQALGQLLDEHVQLSDLGLRLKDAADHVTLESSQLVLRPEVVSALGRVAQRDGLELQPVSTYLANRTSNADPAATAVAQATSERCRSIPYSTITAIDPVPRQAAGASLQLTTGEPAPALGRDQVLLNSWATQELCAPARVEIEYFEVGTGEALVPRTVTLKVAGSVRMEGLGADRTLSPEVPGVHDARDMAEWDPPFPLDLKLIQDGDEDYWDSHGATPKLFVSEATGRRLWGSRHGELTSLRIRAAKPEQVVDPHRVARALLSELDLALFGLRFDDVKARGLAASSGATDFSGLFLGFSFFIIASALLLIALLFLLGVERRADELGLLLALGHPVKSVERRFLAEATVVCLVGALAGCAGAIAYARGVVWALGGLWKPAIGTSDFEVTLRPASLLLGAGLAIVLSLLLIAWCVRRLARRSAVALLARGRSEALVLARPQRPIFAVGSAGLALALSAGGVAKGSANPALFFGSGVLLLVAGLAFFSAWCRGSTGALRLTSPRLSLALNGTARNPLRSVLSVAFIAFASFIIVAVAANQRSYDALAASQRGSGAGGFLLVAESDIPIHHSLAASEGRFELGFSDKDNELLGSAELLGLPVRRGEDASCLNLYQPSEPRLVGVPAGAIAADRFTFQKSLGASADPWSLLEATTTEGVIPAIGDFETVKWILKLGLGDELTVTDGLGQPVRLRIVALLHGSIFQSELLISETNMQRHFPAVEGRSLFLIDLPYDRLDAATVSLESTLSDYGLDVTTSAARLDSYKAVANTYLSTFQTLGGLGLLLGTFGLAVVAVRNVVERRGELASLRAFGFRRRRLIEIVSLEHSILLFVGVTLGAGSALAALAPYLAESGSKLPWASLAITLVSVLVVGGLATAAAAVGALRAQLLATLKQD